MVGLVLLAIPGAVVLVRYFAHPVAAEAMRTTVQGRALGALFPSPAAAPPSPARGGEGQDTLIVIPDISGYTRFIELTRFSLGHAQYVVSELLRSIIGAGEPALRATRVEGDAVLLHAVSNRADAWHGLNGDHVTLGIPELIDAFYRKRARLATTTPVRVRYAATSTGSNPRSSFTAEPSSGRRSVSSTSCTVCR
jgi:hypothetical protein